MAQLKLTADILNGMLEGYSAQIIRLGNRMVDIKQMLDGASNEAAAPSETRKARKNHRLAVRRRMVAS
jgi:hypothetical protein